jgi:hypothetical protein
MREDHPLQPELTGLPPGGPTPGQSAQVVEMSEVAALQAQVLDLGLVREGRPVFVYDAKLAKQKSGNAERQERHRKKIAASGLVVMPVPSAIASAVKDAGGDWSALVAKLGVATPSPPAPLGVAPQTPTTGIGGDEVIPKAVRAEIIEAGGLDQWVQKRVDSAIAALPPVSPVAPKIVEKIVEKQVIKLTSEQKKSLVLGEKVQKMTGWRAAIARKLLGI